MKMTKVRAVALTLGSLVAWSAGSVVGPAQAAPIFVDRFETGVAGANIGAPWGANNITPATYQTAGIPFPGGSVYADVHDPGPGTSPSQAIRLLSNAGNDNSRTPSLSGQVTTYSFDFWEPSRSGDINSLVFGYYRQQSNVDLNSAGRNYSTLLHDGALSPQGGTLAGGVVNYALETVHTVFMMVNDSAAEVIDYQPGHTLAATSADVWISLGGAAPVYAFSVSKQSTASPIAGIGFRTNNADVERFYVDNVLVVSGATFDRSAVPEPAGWLLVAVAGMTSITQLRLRRAA